MLEHYLKYLNQIIANINKGLLVHKENPKQIDTIQDVIFELRIIWEELQNKIRSIKVFSYEPIITSMEDLAVNAIAMAASLHVCMNPLKEEVKDEFAITEIVDSKKKKTGKRISNKRKPETTTKTTTKRGRKKGSKNGKSKKVKK